MNILFVTKGDRSVPSSNFRVWVLRDHLEKGGIVGSVVHSIAYPFWSFSRERRRAWRAIVDPVKRGVCNTLFVHKAHFPFDIAIAIAYAKFRYHIPVVYDID